MAKPKSSDLPAHMALLGLLLEQPNQTVTDIARRLKERFPHARFSTATAHNALPQMAKSPARVRRTHQGETKALDRYEVTPAGEHVYRSWMTESHTGVPALREALYGRIELCRLEDLPILIKMADEEAAVARDLYGEAVVALRHHLEAERKKPLKQPTAEDFLSETRSVLLHISPQHWACRHEINTSISRLLKSVAQRAGLAGSEAAESP
jgi:DNA-binding PadR family transcriptional regulator